MEKKDYTPMGNDNCPTCNYTIEVAAAAVGEHVTPMPHDVSICLNCGEWLEYSDDMALIILTEKTRKELDKQQLITLRRATEFIKKRGTIKRK